MAGSSPQKEGRMADLFAENVAAFLAGDEDAMVNRAI
jgi:hypothetical protein